MCTCSFGLRFSLGAEEAMPYRHRASFDAHILKDQHKKRAPRICRRLLCVRSECLQSAMESSRLATPASARSYRSNATSVTTSIFSVPFAATRDPRAFPLAGASKEHEQLHQQIHDDAAGKRISWWLRQRDKSNEYAKSKGLVVGGPSVTEAFEVKKHTSKAHIAERMTRAFQGAAGRRSSEINELKEDLKEEPKGSLEARNLDLSQLGKEIPQGGRRQILQKPKEMKEVWQSEAETIEIPSEKSRRHRVTGAAAAGKKCMGSKPRAEGIKVHRSGHVCKVDQVMLGRDISASPQKLKEHLSDSSVIENASKMA